MATVGLIGVAFGAALLLFVAPAYRAEVLLLPADVDVASVSGSPYSRFLAPPSSLSILSGVLGAGGFKEEAVASLKSRLVTERFIEENKLIPVLVEPSRNLLLSRATTPSVHDAFDVFDRIRKVTEDRRTGLITLSIKWRDPEVSAKWANDLVRRVNDLLRNRAIEQAETNVAYLKRELEKTSVVELQKAIFSIMEQELNKIMIARGTPEYAFRVLDPAIVPHREARPTRFHIAVVGVLGLFTGVLFLEALRASASAK